jgi:mannosyltransferase
MVLRWTYWVWPGLLTLVIVGYRIDGAPLWRDELATWSAATRPTADLLRLTGTIDAVNGPFYLLMRAWTGLFGDSPTALRAPAALAMAGAATLTAVLGARLFDPRTGTVAGLLFALTPATSRYGQEARAYALATLLAVLASLLLLRALRRPDGRRWLGYAVAVTFLGLAQLVALGVLAGHAAAVLATRRRWPGPRDWLISLLPAAVVLTPLVVLGRRQQGRQLAWVDPPALPDLAGLPGALAQSASVGGLLVGLATVGALTQGRRGALLGLTVALPAPLLFAAGLVTPVWVPRYLLFVLPFGCLLAAAVLAPLGPRVALVVVLLAGLLGAADQAAVRRTHEWPRSAPVDHPGAARIIAAHRRADDAIIYSHRDSWALLDVATAYHLGGDRPRDALLLRDQVARADFWATECPEPARCLAGIGRVWLMVNGERDDPLAALPPKTSAVLRANYHLDRSWTIPGLTVVLLTR